MMRIDKVTDIETDEISYELPNGWMLARIGKFIAQGGVFIDGDWVESKDQNPNGDVRLIQLADIGDGVYRNKSQRFLTFDKAIELGCTFLEIGDVLIARMPDPLGRACIFPGDLKQSVTVVDVCIVRSGSKMINHRWLMYFINSPEFRSKIAAMQSGSTRKRISRGNLARLRLPLPPFAEQHCIVTKIEELFTKLDAGVESLKKVQAQLKRYRQAVLKSAVEGKLTAEWRAIHKDELEPASVLLERIRKEKNKDSKYAGSLIDDKQDKKTDLPDLPDGWVWTKLGTLFEWSNGKGLTQKEMTKGKFPVYGGNGINGSHTNFLSEKESIVIGRVGANCGNVHIAPEKSWITDNAIYSKWITDHLNIRFALYLLFNIGLNKLSGGSGQPYVAQAILNPVTIPLPPLVEQNKIVDEIESCLSIADKVEFIINAELKRAERLRQSILKQAFSGKLVPQDPNDEPASVLLDRIKQEKAKNDNQRKGQKSNDNTEQMKLL
jgi:type I restriction enzyme S subunit